MEAERKTIFLLAGQLRPFLVFIFVAFLRRTDGHTVQLCAMFIVMFKYSPFKYPYRFSEYINTLER